MKKFCFVLSALLLAWACTKEAGEQETGTPLPAGPKDKMEALQELAASLPDRFGGPGTTRSVSKSIVDIVSLDEVLEGVEQKRAVSAPSVSNSLSSAAVSFSAVKARLSAAAVKAIEEDIFVVNYDGEEGFAILSSDSRVPAILAYTEKGSLTAESTPHPGLQIVLDHLPGYIEELMRVPLDSIFDDYTVPRYVPRPDLATTTNKIQLMSTKWDQDAPFNNNMGYAACSQTSNGRYKAGCVAVAVGQLMAFHGHPSVVGGVAQPWAAYRSAVYGDNFSPSAQSSVATLMYDIGQKVYMSYSCTGSGSIGSRARTALVNQYGYTAGSFIPYSLSQVQTNIAAGRPLYVDAYTATPAGTKGHAWVFDGTGTQLNYSEEWIDTFDPMGNLKSSVYNGIVQTYPSNPMLHCNWGWGGTSDGYFVAGIFNPLNKEGNYTYNFYDLYIIPNLQKAPVVKPNNKMTLSRFGSYSSVSAAYPVTSTVTVSCNAVDTMATFYGTLYPGQSSTQINTDYYLTISGVSPSSDASYNYTY